MKDKRIFNGNKIIYWIIFSLIIIYRFILLTKFAFSYVDEDQATLWCQTVKMANFSYMEPHFLGQSYVLFQRK